MNVRLQRMVTAVVLCAMLVLVPRQAKAQGISQGQAIGIFAAIAAVGAAIGVTVYVLVRHTPSITGCAAASGDGMSLVTEGDRQTYALSGDISTIKAGERVRVSGKKTKDKTGNRLFVVNKVGKSYGACSAAP